MNHLIKVKERGGDFFHPFNDPLWQSEDVKYYLRPLPTRYNGATSKAAKQDYHRRYYINRRKLKEADVDLEGVIKKIKSLPSTHPNRNLALHTLNTLKEKGISHEKNGVLHIDVKNKNIMPLLIRDIVAHNNAIQNSKVTSFTNAADAREVANPRMPIVKYSTSLEESSQKMQIWSMCSPHSMHQSITCILVILLVTLDGAYLRQMTGSRN
jgi:glutamate synthase domain-containing protein 2